LESSLNALISSILLSLFAELLHHLYIPLLTFGDDFHMAGKNLNPPSDGWLKKI